MRLEAKETARLYTLLSDKLGSDTAKDLFKYIDNKTERAVEGAVKTLATKDDIINFSKEIANSKSEVLKWMFIFGLGQIGATVAVIILFLKK